jgi:hypothetical protein
MRTVVLIITILIISFIGCNKEEQKKRIPRKEFVQLLVDIHLMDGMLSNSDFRRKLAKRDTADYYNELIREHGYTKAQFDSTIDYYSHDLKEFDKIYQKVLSQLSQKESRIKQKIEQKMKREKEDTTKEDNKENSTKPESEPM